MLNVYKNSKGTTLKNNTLRSIVPPPASVKTPSIENLNNLNKWNHINHKPVYIGEVSSNYLLKSLPEEDLARFIPYFQTINFNCGENIYQPNDNGQFLYFPETAVFSQLNVLEDGRTVETSMIGNEGMAGIATIFDCEKPFTSWTQALIGGTALKINASMFRKEFWRTGVLHAAFFDYLSSYINQLTQKAICNQHHLIEERFCTWLLMIDDRCGKNNLILTHEQIAHFLGVHRPSVTCVAQSLRDRGIIKYSRGRIFITDRPVLESLACECYNVIN
jgi:CRP-like cAMP-binding protein